MDENGESTMGPPSPFRMVEHTSEEEHPVDVAVTRRLQNEAQRHEIWRATKELMEALGERRELWLRLEVLLNDYKAEREEAYFNIGYEHGLAAGRAEILRGSAGEALVPDGLAFADRIRDLAVQANLPVGSTVAALLETAWAFALVLDGRNDAGRP